MKNINKIFTVLIFCCSLACVVNAQVSTSNTIPIRMTKAKVTLNVYSGRENPKWILTKIQTKELLDVINKLPESKQNESFDGLGYTGLRVIISNVTPKKTYELFAYKGHITYTHEDIIEYFDDKSLSVESFLLQSGISILAPDLYKYVKGEIKSFKK